ncbi:MAG: ATP-binding protein [Actinomycetota bacterium]
MASDGLTPGHGPAPSASPTTGAISEPERARRNLWVAVVIFRWASIGWMGALAFSADRPFREPAIAWLGIAMAALWAAWFTASPEHLRTATLVADLVLSFGLVLASGYVIESGDILGEQPSYTSFYPYTTAIAWGAARGRIAGLAAGLTVGLASILNRPVNGVALADLSRGEVQNLVTGVVIYAVTGLAVGSVSRVLHRSAAQLRSAVEEAMRERERAARLEERESIARQIHDSVLQSLAFVHKRGHELGAQENVQGSEVATLAELAGSQEQLLRAMIAREPQTAPSGRSSLRDALEAVARTVTGIPVTVGAVGPLWRPIREVEELAAAVRQALENVVEHASATRTSVFAEEEAGMLTVTVRDDGTGFVYREERLEEAGKLGMLRSMKGRVEQLGGGMRVLSAPGTGTEVEFVIPSRPERAGG